MRKFHYHLGFVLSITLLGPILLIAQSQITLVNTPLERGQFTGSRRTGQWEFYDRPSELSLKINYDERQLVYVKPDTSDFIVMRNDRLVRRKLEIPCRFHGSLTNLFDHYYRNFSFPHEIVLQRQPVLTWLTFDIGEEGIARNPVATTIQGWVLEKKS